MRRLFSRSGEHGEGARALAGGQSLVPLMNLRVLRPAALIDLNGIPAVAPRVEGGRLSLSAMTRYSEALNSELARCHTPLLTSAIAHVGNVRVRNRGTLGGALAHGQATSELAAVVLALGGEVLAYGPGGARVIDTEEFFLGHLRTALRPAEVVTGLRLEAVQPGQGWSFQELARRRGSEAVAGVAANLTLSSRRDAIDGVRLGLIGVDDRPVAGDRAVLSSLRRSDPHARGDRRGSRRSDCTNGSGDRLAGYGLVPTSPGEGVGSSGLDRGAATRRGEGGDRMSLQQVTLQVNGVAHEISVSPDALLLDVLHDQLGFTDVRYGCGEGVCGTCTVLLDGEAVSGCLVYAVQVEFREITTLAGSAWRGRVVASPSRDVPASWGNPVRVLHPGSDPHRLQPCRESAAAHQRAGPLRARRAAFAVAPATRRSSTRSSPISTTGPLYPRRREVERFDRWLRYRASRSSCPGHRPSSTSDPGVAEPPSPSAETSEPQTHR